MSADTVVSYESRKSNQESIVLAAHVWVCGGELVGILYFLPASTLDGAKAQVESTCAKESVQCASCAALLKLQVNAAVQRRGS